MAKGLRNIPDKDRAAVIKRRAEQEKVGLGKWGALDALRKIQRGKVKNGK